MKDERLSAHSIEVAVVNGAATLTGSVPSYRRKLAAIHIAESIRGCLDVVDKIIVEPPGGVSDEEIAENTRSALETSADITKEAITVLVKDGVVTLQGTVSSQWESVLAEDITLNSRGVRKVRNLLLVEPACKAEDVELTRSIMDTLSHTANLENQEVRVAVTGNKAVLSGRVSELWQKKRADEVTKRFPVVLLRNEIAVGQDGKQ